MRRILTALLAAAALLALAAAPVLSPVAPTGTVDAVSQAGTARAGVASVDASWHLGASGGQFSDTAPGITPDHYDPHLHATRKVPADTLGTQVKTRALLLEGADGNRVAVVANDLYLPNDLLNRRVGQLLEERDLQITAGLVEGEPTGITDENLAITVSHNHNSAFYSTPAWGTWIFQDVFDIRFFEYYAQAMADAVVEAASDLRPVRMGAATVPFNEIQSHTYGPKVAIDGTPAGQPYSHVTGQLSVVVFDDITDPDDPQPFINWVTLGLHPEWTWGYDVINGDITHATMRLVDRELGTTTVMSQRETGSSGPHKDLRVHEPHERREFQDNGLEQLDHGARLWADAIKEAIAVIHEERDVVRWDPVTAVAANQAERGTGVASGPATHSTSPVALLPFETGFTVGSLSRRFAPPVMRPVPGISNCNTRQLFHGNPQLPVLGFPDCENFGLDEYGKQVVDATPVDEAALYDQLKAAGVPIPDSYSATALTAVEETAAVHIQVMRLGDLGVTFCPCEQFTDTALNIQTRLDRDPDTLWVGWDWEALTRPDGTDWCRPGATEGTMSCADPRTAGTTVLADVPTEAVERMRAQISNTAGTWETDVASAFGESEASDPAAIFGNFRHEQRTEHGYGMVIAAGMANDYFGYVPNYREMRAHEHYRKALNGLGLHGADYLADRLVGLAAELNGDEAYPTTPLDLAYQAESTRADTLARAIGHIAANHTDVYDAALGPDGGTPRIVTQPPDIERFDAAEATWVGGSNWTDLPSVAVERRTPAGDWEVVGDQDGEVQVRVDFPTPADAVAIEVGTYEWTWTANFEAFASDLSLPEPDGERVTATPAGTHRFVIDGRHRSGVGQVEPYHLTSEPFQVDVWRGITADVASNSGVTVVEVGPRSEVSMDDGASTYTFGPIDYPDTYESSFPFVSGQRERFTYRPGTEDDQFYCRFCRFRPWVDTGGAARVVVTVTRADGTTERVEAVPTAPGVWRAPTRLRSGDTAAVLPGDVTDAYGNTNGGAL